MLSWTRQHWFGDAETQPEPDGVSEVIKPYVDALRSCAASGAPSGLPWVYMNCADVVAQKFPPQPDVLLALLALAGAVGKPVAKGFGHQFAINLVRAIKQQASADPDHAVFALVNLLDNVNTQNVYLGQSGEETYKVYPEALNGIVENFRNAGANAQNLAVVQLKRLQDAQPRRCQIPPGEIRCSAKTSDELNYYGVSPEAPDLAMKALARISTIGIKPQKIVVPYQISPDNSLIGISAGELVDTNGDKWKIDWRLRVFRNDTPTGITGRKLLWYGGSIYALGAADNVWRRWSGTEWEKFGPTQPGLPSQPTPPTPPAPPVVVTPGPRAPTPPTGPRAPTPSPVTVTLPSETPAWVTPALAAGGAVIVITLLASLFSRPSPRPVYYPTPQPMYGAHRRRARRDDPEKKAREMLERYGSIAAAGRIAEVYYERAGTEAKAQFWDRVIGYLQRGRHYLQPKG